MRAIQRRMNCLRWSCVSGLDAASLRQSLKLGTCVCAAVAVRPAIAKARTTERMGTVSVASDPPELEIKRNTEAQMRKLTTRPQGANRRGFHCAVCREPVSWFLRNRTPVRSPERHTTRHGFIAPSLSNTKVNEVETCTEPSSSRQAPVCDRSRMIHPIIGGPLPRTSWAPSWVLRLSARRRSIICQVSAANDCNQIKSIAETHLVAIRGSHCAAVRPAALTIQLSNRNKSIARPYLPINRRVAWMTHEQTAGEAMARTGHHASLCAIPGWTPHATRGPDWCRPVPSLPRPPSRPSDVTSSFRTDA
jgi:hypothetical protein